MNIPTDTTLSTLLKDVANTFEIHIPHEISQT